MCTSVAWHHDIMASWRHGVCLLGSAGADWQDKQWPNVSKRQPLWLYRDTLKHIGIFCMKGTPYLCLPRKYTLRVVLVGLLGQERQRSILSSESPILKTPASNSGLLHKVIFMTYGSLVCKIRPSNVLWTDESFTVWIDKTPFQIKQMIWDRMFMV